MSEGHLRLNHPKLCQVATSLGLLGAKRWSKAVCFSKCCRGSFVIKLSRLSEVCFFAFEIVDFEQSCRSFTGCRCKNRRVGKGEAIVVQEVADRPHHCV